MRAAYIKNYGAGEKLYLGDFEIPKFGDNDVLVRIKAASINPVDFKLKEGKLKFLRKYSFPLILGHDLSGEITEVGRNVTKFKKGDLIFSRPNNRRIGTFAECIAIDQDEVSLKPSNLSFEEAASLPLVGLTTWQAFDAANVRAGQKILIQAGAGGIGSFAIQLAKVRGAEVWTTASEKNRSLVESLGADHFIDYRVKPPWEVIKNLDFVFDTLGGENLNRSFEMLKPGGWVVSISGTPDHKTAQDLHLGVFKSLALWLAGRELNRLASSKKTHYRFLFMKPSGEQLDQIRALVEQGKIHPVIDKIFPLAEVEQALEYSETGRARGKIVIKIEA